MARILMLDIGGVFYRAWPGESFWPRWSARMGVDRAVIEAWLSGGDESRQARLGKISATEFFARAASRHGVDPQMFKTLFEEAYTSDFNTRFADFVRELGGRVETWALTNSKSSEAVLMRRPGLKGLFKGVISSCDCGLAKPDPAIFAFAAQRAGAEPRDILFIDDVAGHVEAARAGGFEAMVFDETDNVIRELSRRW